MSMSLDVLTFLNACDQEPSMDNINLYFKLIQEEYEEFLHAQDTVEELDACMDMIWVILGYCYMRGFKVDAAWLEVARSNLAKINIKTGKVIKREDGKVMKPHNWTPPDLTNYV